MRISTCLSPEAIPLSRPFNRIMVWTLLLFMVQVTSASAQWIPTLGPPGTDITGLYANSTHVFVGTLNGVYRSADSGTTWIPRNIGLTDPNINSFAHNGTALFAGTFGGQVFRSTNNGDNWTNVTAGLPEEREDEQPIIAKGSTVFVGTGQGVYKTTNDGDTWTAVNTGLPTDNGDPQRIRSLAVLNTDLFAGLSGGDGVYRSTNDGDTWTAANTGLPDGGDIRDMAAVGFTLFGAIHDGVYRTTDNGANWSAVNTGLTNTRVEVLGVSGSSLFAGTDGGGLFRTTDNGDNWTAVNTGLTSKSIFSFAAQNTTIFAGTLGGGVHRSTNNGDNWTPVNTGLPNLISVSAVAVGTAGLYASAYSGSVFRSINQGTTWISVSNGLPGSSVESMVLNGTVLFAGTPNGVYRSTDNGANWTAKNSGLPTPNNVNQFLAAAGAVFVISDNDGRVYRTSNNGDSWTSASNGLENTRVEALGVKGNVLFAGTGSGVYRSTDNGDSWTQTGSGLPQNDVRAFAVIDSFLFVGSEEGWVYRTSDNGDTWNPADTGLPEHGGIDALAAAGPVLFAGTQGQGVYYTSDKGGSWNPLGPPNTFITSLAADGPTLFAGLLGGGVILTNTSTLGPVTDRTIKVKLSLSAKVGIGPLVTTVTVPVDSGTLDIGRLNIIEPHDLSGIPNGEALQPFFNQIENLSLIIPNEAITDDNITLDVQFRNINAVNTSNIKIDPVVVRGDTVPVFLYLRMAVRQAGITRDRFDFRDGFPMILRVPLNQLTGLLDRSGFTGVSLDSLTFAFLTPQGLTREGIFTARDPITGDLVFQVTHLSDMVGVKSSSLAPPGPPAIIQGPVAEPDTNSAVIAWRTDQPTGSVVRYGLTKGLTDSVVNIADSSGVTIHVVQLTGLTKSTQYFYRVLSTDLLGQTAVSAIDSFKTSGIPDLAPPIISLGPFDLDVTPTTAVIGWDTDRRSTSEVRYDTTFALGNIASDNALDLRHAVTLSGLISSKTYRYIVRSVGGGGTVASDTLRFSTPAALDTLPPIITRQPRVDDFAVTDTTALVRWDTDVASNSQVFYWKEGTTDTLVAFNPVLRSDGHAVILTRLAPNTRYVYFARSTRVTNNRSVVSRLDQFRTRPPGEVVPLRFVVSPQLAYRSDIRAVFTWRTNVPSDGFVYYQEDPTRTGLFKLDQSLVRGSADFTNNHRVSVGGLEAGKSYLFVITSSAPSGEFLIWPPTTVFAKPIVQGEIRVLIPTGIAQVPGTTGRFTTNQQPDTQAPVILNGPTVISQTNNQLIIQWETDELSSSTVQFGPGGTLTSTATDPTQVTLHQVTLTNLSSNTSYAYQVASTDPSNNGPTQSTQAVAVTALTTDTAPPVIDAASITSSPSNDRATIQWTTNEAATTEVSFGAHADSLNTTVADPSALTAHTSTLTGLSPSKTYFYKVASTDVTGNGPTRSATKSFTTTAVADTARPVISNIQAASVAKPDSTATITLTWTTDKVATTFVDYDTVSTVGLTVGDQTGVTAHSMSITNLQLGKTYHYRVGSVNVNDTRVPAPSTQSTVATLTTPSAVDATAPTTPATLTLIPGDGAVLVRWSSSTDASGIAGYALARNSVSLVSNVSDTTYLDQTVVNGTAYGYTVTAVDRAGNIGTPKVSTANVTPATSQTPSSPTAIATPDTVSLKPILILGNATPVTGDATRATLTYTFEVATDTTFTAPVATRSGIPQGVSTNPTHWQVLDTGRPDSTALTSGVKYWWRARANDGAFNGPWSQNSSFVTSSAKPTRVELAAFTAESDRNAVIVKWTVSRTAYANAGFHVYRSLQPTTGFERITDALITGETTFSYVDHAVRVNQVYYYLIEAVSATGETSRFGPVSLRVAAPRTFALHQNAPNPFNPTTTIRFDLPNPATVSLRVYNLLGQEVARLMDNQAMEAGFHQILWNGRNAAGQTVASGVYLYRIETGGFLNTKKMLLLK